MLALRESYVMLDNPLYVKKKTDKEMGRIETNRRHVFANVVYVYRKIVI